MNWVDKDGNVVAPVTANDWVSSAHYACDANNDSDTFYTMSGVIAGADAYYDWTAYQMALPDATDGTDKDGNAVKFITNEDGEQEILEEVPEASIDDIGVKAVDDYTLEFTLESSRPYFLSMVSFGPYMPVYGPFLDECGSKFGTDNSTLLYCGAFILSTYQPQQQRVGGHPGQAAAGHGENHQKRREERKHKVRANADGGTAKGHSIRTLGSDQRRDDQGGGSGINRAVLPQQSAAGKAG